MKYKPYDSTGVELPVIGQGTWDIPESGSRLAEAKRALRRGIELGMTHIDTAEMYGSGRAEEIVGEAIAGVAREKLFIATKVLPSNATYDGTIKACDRSLRRLRSSYLDLFMLHWPGSHPLEGTMRALESLVERGKSRFIGVSNFDLAELQGAQTFLGKVPLSCNQVLYHLNERGVEHTLLPYCRREGIAIVAYTPFGRGAFMRRKEGRAVLEEIGRAHNATAHQVALAFLVRDPIVFAIPKASDTRHVEENAAAANVTLSEADIAAIDAAYPVGERGPLAML
jgi:diketogulonate reductase-like aldo/keto reductase